MQKGIKIDIILRDEEKDMFRELTRKNKQISMEECIALLQKEKRGVLLRI